MDHSVLQAGRYTQFLVVNRDGRDSRPCKVGLFETGTDLRFTLRRAAGAYTLTVENLSTREASTLTVPDPDAPGKTRTRGRT